MKQALIPDNIDRGTTYSFLQANGFYITKKELKSGVANWESICDILKSDSANELLVIGKFTEIILDNFLLKEYEDVSVRLVEHILTKRHLIFIYKENYEGYLNLEGEYTFPDNVRGYKKEFVQELKSLIEKFTYLDLNLVVYEKIIDLEISSQNFIEEISQGLLLKFYIPNEKYGSSELDKFIVLFKEFISTVTNKSINISQNRTKYGITCTLYSESNEIKQDDLYGMFDDFTKFMELCVNDPKSAAEILSKNNIPADRAAFLITKHTKEAKRIILDLKQDKERRLLSTRQSLETELLEEELGSDLFKKIELMIPNINGIKDLIEEKNITNLNININPQIIQKVEGIVAREFNGTITFTNEDNQLKDIIQKYSETSAKSAELISALYEVQDKELSLKSKKAATNKLKSFLVKVGEKVGDVAFDLLTKYLESKMGI
jgi:hypothetical protein